MNHKLEFLFNENDFYDNHNKMVSLINATKGTMLTIQSMTFNIANLNFQNENMFNIDVDEFNEIEDGDFLELSYKKGRARLLSGIARIKEKKTDRTGNKTLSVSLEYPLLSKREFRKVILSDEFFIRKSASNPDDVDNSILHIIAERLGFPVKDEYNDLGKLIVSNRTKFDLAKFYYNAGMSKNADIPFTLFKKGDRWIDELTTIVDSIGGWIFIDQDFNLVYRSYVDVKFKEAIKEFTLSDIHTSLPYKYNPGTNNGVKIDFDRFELEEELKDVFKAEKKAYAKVGEKLNLKLKYITDIVVEPKVKSCKVYYYIEEKPVYLDDYSPYVTFNLNSNNGEIVVDNTFTHDIYIDDVIIEGKALVKYADNSSILKDKKIVEELQEDFFSIGKNKYIQTFYGARSKAVSEYYNKVKDTHNLEISIDFHPEYELGDKISLNNKDYCIDKISHTFDHRAGYRTKLSLIQVLDPDFLNILWKETETVNADRPSMDLDFVNGAIDDAKEDISKDVLDKANGYTEEVKQRLEEQLAEDVKKLENTDKLINTAINTEKKRLDGVAEELNSEKDKLTQLGQDLISKEEGLKSEIKVERDRITSTVGEVEKLDDKVSENKTAITQVKDEIKLKASQTDVDTLNGKVSNAEATLSVQAGEIQLKASKTEVDAISNRVNSAETSITNNADAIALKASKSSVDNLTGRVTNAESQLTVQANEIATKVSSKNYESDKDKLENRISATETSIVQNAEQIALKASKTELNTLTGRVTTAESSITANTNAISLKASQSTVDELSGRVSTAEASITVESNKITQEVSDRKTAVNNLEKKVTDNTTAITQTSNNINLMAESLTNHDGLLHSGEHLISQINIAPGEISIDAKKVNIGNGILLVEKINSIESISASANDKANSAQSTADSANANATDAKNKADTVQNNVSQGKVTLNANTTVNGDFKVNGASVELNASTKINGMLEVFGGDKGIISYNGTTEANSTKRVIIRGGEIVFQYKI